ncbi:hypothetical protein [Kitasatospora viridis]|uniref:Resolvase-like protein n=1 Tax=Kitasatospora viridis TaxID=281105 RepID=A0A561SDN5_9ACTN|nr:hypothetical protein [Kitasatospora viridis]TWF72981.1 hypothetical protein FHX73_16132 [Kitasatospora viridis]
MLAADSGAVRRTAMYLRRYPYDSGELLDVRLDLAKYAVERGLGDPVVFMDNGGRTGGPLPALARLTKAVAAGWFEVVVVPGPFVFALDDDAARESVRRLEAAGCQVVERSRTCALVR